MHTSCCEFTRTYTCKYETMHEGNNVLKSNAHQNKVKADLTCLHSIQILLRTRPICVCLWKTTVNEWSGYPKNTWTNAVSVVLVHRCSLTGQDAMCWGQEQFMVNVSRCEHNCITHTIRSMNRSRSCVAVLRSVGYTLAALWSRTQYAQGQEWPGAVQEQVWATRLVISSRRIRSSRTCWGSGSGTPGFVCVSQRRAMWPYDAAGLWMEWGM